MKEGIITIIGVPLVIAGFAFGFYGFLAFGIWMFSDPLDLIPDIDFSLDVPQPSQSSKWNECISDTKVVFDDFTDTAGASYALEDLPSQGVREFMEYCLNKS